MEATFGDLLDLASDRLARAWLDLPPRPVLHGTERNALAREILGTLRGVESYVGEFGWHGEHSVRSREGGLFGPATVTVLTGVRDASSRIAAGMSRAAPWHPPAGAENSIDRSLAQLQDANRCLGLARDVARSHTGPDGEPLTPYARTLWTTGGRLHVLRIMGALAGQAGDFTRALATSMHVPENRMASLRLREAAVLLAQCSDVVKTATHGAPAYLGALPVAPHLTPSPLMADEEPHSLAPQIRSACDRMRTAAYQAERSADFQPEFRASALRGVIRPIAMAHLLAGNILRETAAGAPGHLQSPLRDTADRLREAAMSWQAVSQRWQRVADLGDAGTGRPDRRPNGQHPSVVDAGAMAVRTGRLLFGGDWTPQTKVKAGPHSSDQILESAGGGASLLEAVRRIPSAAAALAESAPTLLRRISGDLVTDDPAFDHREAKRPIGERRWFPIAEGQLEALGSAYDAARHTSMAAADTVAALATTALHAPSARATLDAVAQDGRRVADRADPARVTLQATRPRDRSFKAT